MVGNEEFQLEGNDGSYERFGCRVSKNYGNVFYKDYLKMVLGREFDEIMDYHDAAVAMSWRCDLDCWTSPT